MVAPRLPWIECLASSRPYPVEAIDSLAVGLGITGMRFGGLRPAPESLTVGMSIASGQIRGTRLCLDDKRVTQLATRSDIILAYIRGSGLYYRQQRDRFQVERLLRDEILPITRLRNVGMSRSLRLQFELV